MKWLFQRQPTSMPNLQHKLYKKQGLRGWGGVKSPTLIITRGHYGKIYPQINIPTEHFSVIYSSIVLTVINDSILKSKNLKISILIMILSLVGKTNSIMQKQRKSKQLRNKK